MSRHDKPRISSIKPLPREGEEVAPTKKGDDANWAGSVSRLETKDVPNEALNLNVEGRKVNSPIQGFGKMWQKTYKVPLEGAAVSPQDVIAAWKKHFPEFWPKGNKFFGPLTGIAPGEVAVLNLTLPGKMKLSTGVLVIYADDESFTLMTPQGHMFAGWITFSSFVKNGLTVAQAQVLMRASDPMYEVGLTLGGHKQEDRFWDQTLTKLAKHFGVRRPNVETQVLCVEKRRQWKNAKNIWYNAAIRSTMYSLLHPFSGRKRRKTAGS